MFKKEVDRLVLLGVLELDNDSEWGSQSFAQTKKKSNQVNFLSDFKNLNKKLNHKPYQMPNINAILLKLEGFQYAMSIDLDMGYYHILISDNSSNLCTIIILWRKY